MGSPSAGSSAAVLGARFGSTAVRSHARSAGTSTSRHGAPSWTASDASRQRSSVTPRQSPVDHGMSRNGAACCAAMAICQYPPSGVGPSATSTPASASRAAAISPAREAAACRRRSRRPGACAVAGAKAWNSASARPGPAAARSRCHRPAFGGPARRRRPARAGTPRSPRVGRSRCVSSSSASWSRAASTGDNVGSSRVFERPGRGALVAIRMRIA